MTCAFVHEVPSSCHTVSSDHDTVNAWKGMKLERVLFPGPPATSTAVPDGTRGSCDQPPGPLTIVAARPPLSSTHIVASPVPNPEACTGPASASAGDTV